MKQVNYWVKLILSDSGTMMNSSCECPAGAGPYSTCKHIAAAMFVLVEFSETGYLRVDKACTEELQQFHRPKKGHKGSPVKASDLGKNSQVDDPRPLHLRNRECYTSEVLMKTVNFSYFSGMDLSLRYALPRADVQSASQDHDYLKVPFTHR